MDINNSKKYFSESKNYIPGGVNSPVRAFKSVGGVPVFMESSTGSKMTDTDGNEYIDYIGSWGPHLFGHNPDFIKSELLKAIEKGVSFGTPTALEIEMARLVTEIVPSVESVRMVNSGTEATMSAIRVARGYTRKSKIIKFEGCYHGHADYFLIKAGSGALTLGVPTSPGVTKGTATDTLLAKFNDIESVKKLVTANKNEIAALIIEPIAGNMGVIPMQQDFAKELRRVCDEENIVLIFDEVMTGFRVAAGGAQELYSVKPDMTTMGKIIGGGLPVGAFGGKKEIMNQLAPAGPVYQAGTLSGNPLAMTAGIATLKNIKNNPQIYTELEKKSTYLEDGMRDNLKKLSLNYYMTRIGSMSCMFFTDKEVLNFDDAVKSDTEMYGKYFHEMLNQGVYLAPAQFEAMFISTAHSTADLDKTVAAHYSALKKLH